MIIERLEYPHRIYTDLEPECDGVLASFHIGENVHSWQLVLATDLGHVYFCRECGVCRMVKSEESADIYWSFGEDHDLVVK